MYNAAVLIRRAPGYGPDLIRFAAICGVAAAAII